MNPVTISHLDSTTTQDILTIADDHLHEQGCRYFYHTAPPKNSVLVNSVHTHAYHSIYIIHVYIYMNILMQMSTNTETRHLHVMTYSEIELTMTSNNITWL